VIPASFSAPAVLLLVDHGALIDSRGVIADVALCAASPL
jgi:hypothetical protein